MKMKGRLKRLIVPIGVVSSILLSTGCIGHMALTEKVKKGNLSLTENRWGREGIFLGFNIFYVYRISSLLDLVVFNSIEFWSGENPLNQKSAMADIPKETVEKIFGETDVHLAQVERINATEAKMYLSFTNGDKLTFDVHRSSDTYTVSYLGREFYAGQINENIIRKEEV